MIYADLYKVLNVSLDDTDLELTPEETTAVLESAEVMAALIGLQAKLGGQLPKWTKVVLSVDWRFSCDVGPVRQYRSVSILLHTSPVEGYTIQIREPLPELILSRYPWLDEVILHKDYVCLALVQLAKDVTQVEKLNVIQNDSEGDYFPAEEGRARFEAHAAGLRAMMGW